MAARQQLTVTQAAAKLGCSTSTVRRLVRSQQLSGHRVGRVMVVSLSSVEAYLDRNKIGPKS